MHNTYLHIYIYKYGGFLKWRYPQNQWFREMVIRKPHWSPSITVPITVLSLGHRNAAIPASVHCDLGQHHVDRGHSRNNSNMKFLIMGI
jgi:hypothetical protein